MSWSSVDPSAWDSHLSTTSLPGSGKQGQKWGAPRLLHHETPCSPQAGCVGGLAVECCRSSFPLWDSCAQGAWMPWALLRCWLCWDRDTQAGTGGLGGPQGDPNPAWVPCGLGSCFFMPFPRPGACKALGGCLAQVTPCRWEGAFSVCLEDGEDVLGVALALQCLPRAGSPRAMALEDAVC